MKFAIESFVDFCSALDGVGFSMGGENDEGVFSLSRFFAPHIAWHTDNAQTDPWVWRMRVLDEREGNGNNKYAYAKLFFSKSGYITKEWYPYFLAVRRGANSFNDAYQAGTISHNAKRIYDVISPNEQMPLHVIKQLAGFAPEDKSKFDRALTELQMKLYLTMCGQSRKVSKTGADYGWSATSFCRVEHFFGETVFEQAAALSPTTAAEQITTQIYKLNPNAQEKKVKKFIWG